MSFDWYTQFRNKSVCPCGQTFYDNLPVYLQPKYKRRVGKQQVNEPVPKGVLKYNDKHRDERKQESKPHSPPRQPKLTIITSPRDLPPSYKREKKEKREKKRTSTTLEKELINRSQHHLHDLKHTGREIGDENNDLVPFDERAFLIELDFWEKREKKEENNRPPTCPICLDVEANVALNPCMHLVCRSCKDNLAHFSFQECPICKTSLIN